MFLPNQEKTQACKTIQVILCSKMETFTVHKTKSNKSNNIDLFSNNLIKYYVLVRIGMECELRVMLSALELLLYWNRFGLGQFGSPR